MKMVMISMMLLSLYLTKSNNSRFLKNKEVNIYIYIIIRKMMTMFSKMNQKCKIIFIIISVK